LYKDKRRTARRRNRGVHESGEMLNLLRCQRIGKVLFRRQPRVKYLLQASDGPQF
jgi:hypothetical protein